ncbi:hypothetical protein D9M69_350040 [compost metagenome]
MSYNRLEEPAQRARQLRETIAGEGAEEGVVGEQARKHRRDLGIVIGSDGFKFAHWSLLFWNRLGKKVEAPQYGA